MKNLYLLLIILLSYISYSQASYIRSWGTMTVPNFGSQQIAKTNPVNGNLYFVTNSSKINEVTINNLNSKLIYTFPPSLGGTLFENINFDSKGNILISGRTLGTAPVTTGSYSQNPISCNPGGICVHTGATFIMKIDTNGILIWCTYFHCLSQNNTHLTLDKNDNIYYVSKRYKNITLTTSPFQTTADTSSIINHQDVITKLNSSGQHVWSTFYTKDQSLIKSIVAGDDGIYVYGDHMESTSNSNYFGTPGSYQEYATGAFTGAGGNEKNVFLSKFNFNGGRVWSTYFAVDRSMVPHSETLRYFGGLTVINNEPYILTKHEILPVMTKNPTTKGAFLTSQVSLSQYDITATKFSSLGKRLWTSFLYYGETIEQPFDTNELFISGTLLNNITNVTSLVSKDGYQTNPGTLKPDNYHFTMSLDGSKMNYGTFYGFNGADMGTVFATKNGYYVVGFSWLNKTATSPFVTSNATLNSFIYDINGKDYWGNYIGYFKRKSSLSLDSNDNIFFFNIYPNPTTEILNIQFKDILPENTQFTIYNVAGKKILDVKAQSTEVNQINVSNLSAGVYVLQINNNGTNQTVKFIKK